MNKKVFSYKNALTSARKAGLLTSLIKGKNVKEALDLLEYSDKKASKFWQKLLKSALGYFEGTDAANVVVEQAYTGRGDMVNLKRGRPSGRSHYWPYKLYRAHLYLVLREKEVSKEKSENNSK